MSLLLASLRTVEHAGGALKIFLALLPVLGLVAMTVAMLRFVLRQDERQRRTFVDAAAVGLVVTGVIAMSLGFLQNAGLCRIGLIWVGPICVASWGIALPFVRRRYT